MRERACHINLPNGHYADGRTYITKSEKKIALAVIVFHIKWSCFQRAHSTDTSPLQLIYVNSSATTTSTVRQMTSTLTRQSLRMYVRMYVYTYTNQACTCVSTQTKHASHRHDGPEIRVKEQRRRQHRLQISRKDHGRHKQQHGIHVVVAANRHTY